MATSKTPTVPIVDLSPFSSAQRLDSQLHAAQALAESCHKNGYVGLTGHGVPPSLLQAAFTMMRQFFSLSLEDKMKAPHPDAPTPHRGYSALGRERAAGKASQETDDETCKKALEKSMDAKVGLSRNERVLLVMRIPACLIRVTGGRRKSTTLAAKPTSSTTSGCPKTFCRGFAR